MLPDDALELLLKALGAAAGENAVSISAQLANVRVYLNGLYDFIYLCPCSTLASLCFQSCNQAHICVQLSAEWPGTSICFKLLESACGNNTRPISRTTISSGCIPPGNRSYRQLSPRSAQLLHVKALMHCDGISEMIFEAVSTRVVSYEPIIALSASHTATNAVVSDPAFAR